jgi:hypothetical protein
LGYLVNSGVDLADYASRCGGGDGLASAFATIFLSAIFLSFVFFSRQSPLQDDSEREMKAVERNEDGRKENARSDGTSCGVEPPHGKREKKNSEKGTLIFADPR